MQMYDEYFLVTGGAGFIGSHFLRYFVGKHPEFHFTCVDKLNYASGFSLENVRDISGSPNFEFVHCDLSKDERFCIDDRIDNIINFAAESCVDRSFLDPKGFILNNILSATNLLENVRRTLEEQPHRRNRLRFIHISTDEVYGETPSKSPVLETASLNPTNPYAATKASVDMILKSYQYSYNLPIVILRPNNVYGPNQYPEKLIPLTLQCLQEGKPVPIHGIGSNKRTYLHVRDFVRSIELVWDAFRKGETSVIGEIFNVGGKDEMRNIQLVEYISSMFHADISGSSGLKSPIYVHVKDRNYNDSNYQINCDKIKNLGWSAKVPFHEGISELIQSAKTCSNSMCTL